MRHRNTSTTRTPKNPVRSSRKLVRTSHKTGGNIVSSSQKWLSGALLAACLLCFNLFLQNTSSGRSLVSNGENRRRHKPRLFLLLGPPKTATTTLQCFLLKAQSSLHRDNHIYLGQVPPDPCVGNYDKKIGYDSGMLAHFYQCESEECWTKNLTTALHKTYRNMTLVFSQEKYATLSIEFWRNLSQSLSNFWDVTVVLTYRRYHEWLPSVRNQKDKAMRTWSARKPPSLLRMMQNGFPFWYIDEVQRRAGAVFDNVTVINFHGEQSPVMQLTCKILDTPHLCHNLPEALDISNPSRNLDYDRLSVKAWERGWVPSNRSRREVAELTRRYQENVLNHSGDFPLLCPSQRVLSLLLNRSLEYERMLLPDFFETPLGRVGLERSFARYVEQHKYCTVDAELLLDTPLWRHFYQTLSSPT